MQPVGRLPAAGCVQRLVLEEFQASVVRGVARPAPASASRRRCSEAGGRQAVDLGLQARALDVVGDGPAVARDLVATPAASCPRRRAGLRRRSGRTRRRRPAPSACTTAPWWVLYGVLSWLNRTSRYGRKTFAVPNSGASSSSSACSGASHVRVVVGLVLRPVGLAVVGLEALVEDQSLVGEALEASPTLRHRPSRPSSVRAARASGPRAAAHRRCPGCGPSRRGPSRPTRRSRPRRRSASSSQTCRRAAPPVAREVGDGGQQPAAVAAASPARLHEQRRRSRSSGPAGSRLLARGQLGRDRTRRTRRWCSSPARPARRGRGSADSRSPSATDRRADASSQSSSTAGGQHGPVGRAPGDDLDPGDLRGVVRRGRPHRDVRRAGQAGERGGESTRAA